MLVCPTSLKENYYALTIAILTKATPERAFDLLENGLPVKKGISVRRRDITNDDVKDMIKLRKAGYTYQAIGDMYGITDKAVYHRIKTYKNK